MSDLETLSADEWKKLNIIARDITLIMEAHNIDSPAIRVSALCIVLGIEIEHAPDKLKIYLQNTIVDLIDGARRRAAGQDTDRSRRAVVLRARAGG